MAHPIAEPLLKALVREAQDDGDGAPVLAVEALPHWSGEERFETEAGPVRVAPCVSALAVRDVLAGRVDSTNGGETLVILTDRDETELGQEVLARVWRRRLVRPSRWDAVRHLFRAHDLDPALARERWLVDLLVDVAPVRGYAPPPSGFLDAAAAWRTALRHALRLDVDRPTVADLLRWGQADAARAALNGPAGRHRQEIAARLEADVGAIAGHVIRLISDGHGGDLVPLGLICDMLWAARTQDSPTVLTARVRFETPLGAKDLLGPVARKWGEAATELVRTAHEDEEADVVSGWIGRAESLLTDLNAIDLAEESDVLPWGFRLRLIEAGRALGAALDDPTDERIHVLEGTVNRVEQHLRAAREDGRDRVRRLTMAGRLVRRIIQPPESADDDLAARTAAFLDDGAWVDAAREEIGHGESSSSLADAYGRLAERIDAEREERDRRFAAAFAGWSAIMPVDPSPLLPIERVLERVLAPVAERAPALLLVLDGLSYPEATRLTEDLRRDGWQEMTPAGERLPPVIAAVPTVTAVSRASLLTGRLGEGGQEIERTGFSDHAALRAVSGSRPPRLFHKSDLRIENGEIAPAVRDAILDTDVRVVGVVVNAVDDHLDKGGQLRLADGLRGIRPLHPLLAAAAEAGRAVVLASDHGHVLEHGSRVRPHPGGGERWRRADPPAGSDEIEISGPRVLRGNGRIIAPMVDTIRYVPTAKRGYHGGATPQEVLCPLVVLTTANVKLEGWEPARGRPPVWWDGERKVLAIPPAPLFAEPLAVTDSKGQALLFTEDGKAATAAPHLIGWIDHLLRGPVLAEQRRSAGRQALDDETIAAFLTILHAAGGVAPAATLAVATGLPSSRVRTKLEALRRMLNVDGYAVLAIEADGTARLNLELLFTQFQILP